jgi:hypothetical protein
VGRWTVNLAESEPPGAAREGSTLEFLRDGDTTTFTQGAPGQTGSVTQEFRVDGEERPLGPTIVSVATLTSSRIIDLVMTIEGDVYGRATYEVSPDGLTLIVKSSTRIPNRPVQESVMVFDRQ